jgi:5-methylcytosine-specific restriction endonuclease McrA
MSALTVSTYRRSRKEYQKNYHAKYYQEHKEEIKRRIQLWKKTHRFQVNESNRKSHERYPKKYKARTFADHHIPLLLTCELCPEDDQRSEKLEHHHPDYDYPEITVTSCVECHNIQHVIPIGDYKQRD